MTDLLEIPGVETPQTYRHTSYKVVQYVRGECRYVYFHVAPSCSRDESLTVRARTDVTCERFVTDGDPPVMGATSQVSSEIKAFQYGTVVKATVGLRQTSMSIV